MIRSPRAFRVKVRDLNVDAYVQRSYDPKHAKNIADHLDMDEIGTFKASKRADGKLYLMDGQHRRAALLDRDMADTDVQTLVYEGLTLQQEAKLHVAYNGKVRRENPLDLFRLEVVAQAPEAVAIQAVLDKHELTLQMGQGTHSISAVSSLRWLFRRGGPRLVDRVLSVLSEAYPNSRDARQDAMLKGMGYVLDRKRGIDVSSLIDKLNKAGTAASLLGSARAYRAATGRALWNETAHVIVSIYNKGRSVNRVAL